jgi:hypothetical protein
MESETSGAPTTLVQSRSTLAWRATFEPLKSELTRSYDWLQFGHLGDAPNAKEAVIPWVERDMQDPRLQQAFPDDFVRRSIAEHANLDLVVGTRLGAAVSRDSLHAAVTKAQLFRGEASWAFGHTALSVLVPDVGSLSWSDIDALRAHPGISDYRSILREIELASAHASSDLELGSAIHREYAARLRRLSHSAESSGVRTARALVWLVVGEVLAPVLGVPVIPGVIASVLGLTVDELKARERSAGWTAVDIRIRALATQSSARSPSGSAPRSGQV